MGDIGLGTVLIALVVLGAVVAILGILHAALKERYEIVTAHVDGTHRGVQHALAHPIKLLLLGVAALFKRMEPEGEVDSNTPTTAEIVIFSTIYTIFFVVATLADVIVTHERFVGYLGGSTDVDDASLGWIGAGAFVATLGIWGLLHQDLDRPAGKTILFRGLEERKQRRRQRWATVGAAITVSAGVAFAIASYEAAVGIDDVVMNFVFWILFMTATYAALFQGGHGLMNSVRPLVAAPMLVLAAPFWVVRGIVWLIWAMIRASLFILGFVFIDTLGSAGVWLRDRVSRGRRPGGGDDGRPQKEITLVTPNPERDAAPTRPAGSSRNGTDAKDGPRRIRSVHVPTTPDRLRGVAPRTPAARVPENRHGEPGDGLNVEDR